MLLSGDGAGSRSRVKVGPAPQHCIHITLEIPQSFPRLSLNPGEAKHRRSLHLAPPFLVADGYEPRATHRRSLHLAPPFLVADDYEPRATHRRSLHLAPPFLVADDYEPRAVAAARSGLLKQGKKEWKQDKKKCFKNNFYFNSYV